MGKLKEQYFAMGGSSSIRSKYGYVHFAKYGRFVFNTKEVNLFDLIITPTDVASWLPAVKILDARPVQLFGVPCKDNRENHTIAIVEENLTDDLYGVPVFTENALRFSKVTRDNEKHVSNHFFATMLPKTCTELPETRYVRFARMGKNMKGFTGIFEAIGNFPDWEWHPSSYMLDRQAEILKLEIEAVGSDMVFYDDEQYVFEYNCSSEAYQHILDTCIFINAATYKPK